MKTRFLLSLFLIVASIVGRDVGPADRYAKVVEDLSQLIRDEMADKQIPAISIALIEDQEVVWSAGFGQARTTVQANADTIYRVGSVSKLFTDVAIMQLVEKRELDLDAPITKYLPSFKPTNPFGAEITLRKLMAHRSGLCREPPVGNYFDPTEPSLEETIASLNKTDLVYEPGTHEKYSNAGVAILGYVIQVLKKRPYNDYINGLLSPLGLTNSAFVPSAFVRSGLADGLMWTLHGRTFKAPTFELGTAPAGCLYSSVNDLARFATVLLAEGNAGHTRILQPETLRQMMALQYSDDGTNGFGLGFRMGTLNGERSAGHNGAIYGFSTHFTVLPDAKLGAAVIASKDFVNMVADKIGIKALAAMLSIKKGSRYPDLTRSTPLPENVVKRLEGTFGGPEKGFELTKGDGSLSLLWDNGGFTETLRARGDKLYSDNHIRLGLTLEASADGNSLKIGDTEYRRISTEKPAESPSRWRGLIGEYGWDHDVLYICERNGKLWAIIEWFEFNPLEEISENVFAFPKRGLYDGEKLIFHRDAVGNATEVIAANVPFKRRSVGPADGKQLRITPLRPIDELRREALKAEPPKESGEFRKSDLVELVKLDPSIKLDVRYARSDNFLGTPFYVQERAFLQKPAAEAVVRVHQKLKEKGYGLMVFDGYRPWSVTKIFWDATPDEHKFLVADPSKGSRHNRGAAIDLTLYDLRTGKEIEMVGTYDEVTDRSYPRYPGGTSLQRWHRELLRQAMEAEGFTVYPEEWWHFDFNDWRTYRIENRMFEDLLRER